MTCGAKKNDAADLSEETVSEVYGFDEKIAANVKKDRFRLSRVLYIIEAALEYFISIMVSGAFLAKVTMYIGLSDNLTGVLTSFVSLGCGFQIFALFFAGRSSVKRIVTVFHIANQLVFSFVYLVPVVPLSKTLKTVLFIIFLLLGHALNNVINSPKINWFMNLVDNDKRGRFTAKKEVVSLIGGMVFSYAMGAVIDSCEAAGDLNSAFIVGAVTLFVLTFLHSLCLILSKEKKISAERKIRFGAEIKQVLFNRSVIKIIILNCLYHVAVYSSTPFFGSYQVNELGFSMMYVSVVSIVYAVVRSVFSPLFGKLADKTSFIKMLTVCYFLLFISFFVNIFTVPSNGKIMYMIYYCIYAVSMAGINSGFINLIYENVAPHQRTCAYALQQSIGGIIGFLATLAAGKLVSFIQERGGFFGIAVYAQQVLSVIGALSAAVIMLYIALAFGKKRKS